MKPFVEILAGALLLASTGRAGAQSQAQPGHADGWSEFEQNLRAYLQADSIVGASALLMRDGQLLKHVNVGQASSASGRDVDDSTLFHWGSITKTLTAIAIMQLRDHGRLTLDDPVVRYLPELRQVNDPFGGIDKVTIRMLLSHSAGFMNPTWPYGSGSAAEPFEPTRWEQLVAMMPYQRLLFEPGRRYGYSNPAFVYLARIVEMLTGDPWDSYVQKNIFAPLGMSRSYFRGTPYHLEQHRSHNYHVRRDSATGSLGIIDNGSDFDTGITTPNGGWNAPLADLATYAAFLTNSAPFGVPATGVPYDVVLKRSSLEEMWKPVHPMSQGYQSGGERWMGLSFFIVGAGEERVLGHTGSQAGFRAFFYFNPRNRMAVIVAYNTTNQASQAGALAQLVQQGAIDLVR